MSKKSLLDSIDIPAPCPKNWEEMIGDNKSRFCGNCEKDIYNISEMRRREARKLLFESKENVCIRMEREPDGRIKTLKKQLHQITRQTSIAAGVLSVSLSLSTMVHAQNEIIIGTTSSTVSTKNQNKTTRRISFTVSDVTNAVIPNAEVKLTNQKTKPEFVVRANDEGVALFNNLPHGRYDVKVSAPYFERYQQLIQIKEPVEPNIKITLAVANSAVGVFVVDWSEIPLFRAIAQNDNEIVKQIVSSGFNINAKDENGETALHIAVEHGNLEIVRFLLDRSAKVNVKDKSKRAPLAMLLYSFGEEDDKLEKILYLLVSKGADVNVRNDEKKTLLMAVCEESVLEIVRFLLKAGANPNLKDEDGETAFDKTNSQEIKNLLIKFGARKSKK